CFGVDGGSIGSEEGVDVLRSFLGGDAPVEQYSLAQCWLGELVESLARVTRGQQDINFLLTSVYAHPFGMAVDRVALR
ncbi:hypothetical protein L0F63_003483, partial [Massospora cicadina]